MMNPIESLSLWVGGAAAKISTVEDREEARVIEPLQEVVLTIEMLVLRRCLLLEMMSIIRELLRETTVEETTVEETRNTNGFFDTQSDGFSALYLGYPGPSPD